MNILLIAPQPFFSERGTPIAVDLVLKVLSERGDQVDVVTYHEGRDVNYAGITLHRIPSIPLVRNVRPGLSWQKVICDFFVLLKAAGLASRRRYQLIHAVEESVFIALGLKWFFRVPYVYDMDSSLSQQIVERYPRLASLSSFFRFFEKLAVKNAKAVAPVCEALAKLVEKYHPEKLVILQDVSLLEKSNS